MYVHYYAYIMADDATAQHSATAVYVYCSLFFVLGDGEGNICRATAKCKNVISRFSLKNFLGNCHASYTRIWMDNTRLLS